jgi:hypothetical protein
MSGKYGPILEDFLEEAMRIEKAADELNLPLRLIGCLAFRLKCPDHVDLHKKMGREVTDIDFISYIKYQRKIINLFRDELGYHWVAPSFARATTLRDLFIDTKTKRKVDVFYDFLDFNHTIEFKKKKRLEVDKPTIPLAELFLEKTQIVELNAKDLKDLIVMFLAHDVSDNFDDSMVNGSYLADILSKDWGFYFTVTTNMDKLLGYLSEVEEIDETQKELVASRVKKLRQMVEDKPKSRRWKSRAKVGDKKRWYKFVHTMDGTHTAE